MWVLLLLWGLASFMALRGNYKNNNAFDFHIDLNTWNSSMFEFGVSNRHWHDDSGRCIETYTLGLLFINFTVDFFNLEEGEV